VAVWRTRAGVTSEQATGYVMDLVWTGLAGAAGGTAPHTAREPAGAERTQSNRAQSRR
jgi:hypothetical protein